VSDGNTCAVAVITGGGGGIGLACAHRFGRTHRVLIADVTMARVDAAIDALRAGGIEAEGIVCDVTAEADVGALAKVATDLGSLAVVAHTAGLSPSMADAHRILDVNLLGTARVLAAFSAHVRPGSVAVCLASISGHRTELPAHDELLADPLRPSFFEDVEAAVSLERPGIGYALSKRGVILLAEEVAYAWGERGGRVVSLSPGLIDTEMGRLEQNAGAKALVAMSAIHRFGTADEIAATIEFLASPEASFITATDIRVDGGAIAGFAHRADDEVRERWNDPWHADDPWAVAGSETK
jgi:NAD(P)-dependent dehydrogenase (short-subunit alcohol dehydrogenase family)